MECFKVARELNACSKKIVLHECAVGNADGTVLFGKNSHLPSSQLGDSTSHIASVATAETELIPVCSIATLESRRTFDDACLVKMDIEGGEETILLAALVACKTRNVPIYVSFHLPWWKSPESFETLQKEIAVLFPLCDMSALKTNGFASVLFQ